MQQYQRIAGAARFLHQECVVLTQDRTSLTRGRGRPSISKSRQAKAGGKNRGRDARLVIAPPDYPSNRLFRFFVLPETLLGIC
jgi:hypothetical protein